MVGHMDTVFPDGTVAERPFAVRDGRAYGPGVDDMKGGLLAGLYALRALRDLRTDTNQRSEPGDWLPFRRLTFVANPDEEIGSPASMEVIRRAAEGADLALVLESARENGDIVSARKGVADYLLVLSGRASHAGVEPEKGRSATVEAAHKTLALTALNGRWPGVTVNVGVVRGGTRSNVVAESATLEIDVRGTTRDEVEAAEAAIREIADQSTVPDVTATLTRRALWWPMEKTPATAQMAQTAGELAQRLGFELKDAATGGASDANTISGMGVPVLDGLGPVGGADHAPGEYLEIDSIVPRSTIIAGLLLSASRAGG
jgi:glutamate carboxypeptidase